MSLAAGGRSPFRVILQELDIKAVEAARCLDIKDAFADLPNGRDAREREEEDEMIGEVPIGAGDRLAARQVFGLEGVSVSR